MGLIKHFNDLLPYLMTFEEALGTNRFQEHPMHLLAARTAWGLPGGSTFCSGCQAGFQPSFTLQICSARGVLSPHFLGHPRAQRAGKMHMVLPRAGAPGRRCRLEGGAEKTWHSPWMSGHRRKSQLLALWMEEGVW